MEDLRARVGQELGTTAWRRVEQARIDTFAAATDDHQFIHVDPGRARNEAGLSGTIAHGFLSLSLLSVMLGEVLPPIAGQVALFNYGFDRIRFLTPVPSGVAVRGQFLLKDLVQEANRLRLVLVVSVQIEGAPRPALVADWLVLAEVRQGGG